jgi:hypothetical protein
MTQAAGKPHLSSVAGDLPPTGFAIDTTGQARLAGQDPRAGTGAGRVILTIANDNNSY